MIYQYVFRLVLALFVLLSVSSSHLNARPSISPVDVQIELSEMKIESSKTEFQKGVPYRFIIKNKGGLAHEWVVMPPVKKHIDKGGKHSHMNIMIRVGEDKLPSGAAVVQDFTFPESGKFEFSCHVPGHYEGGMFLPIIVR